MPSYSRELSILGLLGATLWLPQCSQLTKVDWTLIPPPGGATSSGTTGGSAPISGAAGENAEAGEGGVSGEAGASGEGGAGGEGDVVDNGGGGASGGLGGFGGTLGGTSGGGTGGSIAGGGAAGAPVLHPTCKTAPPVPTTPPDLSNSIVFFDGGPGTNGNRGGRGSSVAPYSGLDGACATAKDKLALPQSDTHAVISLSLADEIFKMPENYKIPRVGVPVVSPLGIQIADSWNGVWPLATGIPISLVCAGVMPANVDTWLTGSGKTGEQSPQDQFTSLAGVYEFVTDLSGAEYSHACSGWSFATNDPDVQASVGSTYSQKDGGLDGFPRFIKYLLYSCDQATSNVLCVAYNKTP
jgi:hypothetical protein